MKLLMTETNIIAQDMIYPLTRLKTLVKLADKANGRKQIYIKPQYVYASPVNATGKSALSEIKSINPDLRAGWIWTTLKSNKSLFIGKYEIDDNNVTHIVLPNQDLPCEWNYISNNLLDLESLF